MNRETKTHLQSGHDLIVGYREDNRPRYYLDLACCVNQARQVELGRGSDWADVVSNARAALSGILQAIEGTVIDDLIAARNDKASDGVTK